MSYGFSYISSFCNIDKTNMIHVIFCFHLTKRLYLQSRKTYISGNKEEVICLKTKINKKIGKN